MKSHLTAFACYLLGYWCFGSEIATVMGKPSDNIAKGMIEREFDLVDETNVHDNSTWVYSLLKKEGVLSTTAVYVLSGDLATTDDFVQGLKLASAHAPVVTTNLGSIDWKSCPTMAAHPNTAFVVIAGNEARELEPKSDLYLGCSAKNILFVTALDQKNDTLMPASNYGPLVRLAAPGNSIEVEDDTGKQLVSGSTPAVSLVAARLAIFARENPTLMGKDLIDEFLLKNSRNVAELDGLIEAGRVYQYESKTSK